MKYFLYVETSSQPKNHMSFITINFIIELKYGLLCFRFFFSSNSDSSLVFFSGFLFVFPSILLRTFAKKCNVWLKHTKHFAIFLNIIRNFAMKSRFFWGNLSSDFHTTYFSVEKWGSFHLIPEQRSSRSVESWNPN